MTDKHAIRTDHAPTPIGPYSQAIRAGNFVFVSGQGPMNVATGQMERSSIEAETRQVLTNLRTILEASGSSIDRVVKTTCFLADMNDFPVFNRVYAEFFTNTPPARSTIQAARLPGDIQVEVECIALVD